MREKLLIVARITASLAFSLPAWPLSEGPWPALSSGAAPFPSSTNAIPLVTGLAVMKLVSDVGCLSQAHLAYFASDGEACSSINTRGHNLGLALQDISQRDSPLAEQP